MQGNVEAEAHAAGRGRPGMPLPADIPRAHTILLHAYNVLFSFYKRDARVWLPETVNPKKQEEEEMTNTLTFDEAMKKHLQTLELYVPIVARVHGASHPEFHEVCKLYDTIVKKTKEAGSIKPDLSEEFAKLREITDTYRVPADVCESYEAVYEMLAELDRAYRAG